MNQPRKPIDQIYRDLKAIAQPIASEIRRSRVRRAALRYDALWLPILCVPVLYVVVVGFAGLAGFDAKLSWWLVALLTLIPPMVGLWMRFQRANQVEVATGAALAALDHELKLADRLSAALEFIEEREPTGLQLAAIHDAERKLSAARQARISAATEAATPGARFTFAAIAAVILIWLGSQIPVASIGGGADPNGPDQIAGRVGGTRDADQDEGPNEQPPTPSERRDRREGQSEQASVTSSEDETPSDARRRGSEPVGSGRSAEARTAQGGGSERGQPSDQAQSTKGDTAKKPKEPKKDEDRRDESERPDEPETPKDPSGATQGQGSGRGSSRSPTASPWSAKDQVVTDDEQDPDEDEDVEDENDESKARGGVQPNLRQRKPPVNRDLQISMGNGNPPPDDANSRGGPGGPKKQRGVAQLVLGVTFPDHVSAEPNPGISKITQERIEPQAQQSDQVQGESRGQRSAPMGHLSTRVLSPWMQQLVRNYSLSLREEGELQ